MSYVGTNGGSSAGGVMERTPCVNFQILEMNKSRGGGGSGYNSVMIVVTVAADVIVW